MSDYADELFDRAKRKYRQEHAREQERIQRDETYAYNWTQAAIGFLSAIVSLFAAVWNSCCYISTAVTQHLGLPDDCRLLTVLRRFRDEYILESADPQRLEELRQYYRLAPSVVRWIKKQSNAEEIWADVANTVQTTVDAIDRDQPELAYKLYKERILTLCSPAQGGN